MKDKEWLPDTKPVSLLKDMNIRSLAAIDLFSVPYRESEIIDFYLDVTLSRC